MMALDKIGFNLKNIGLPGFIFLLFLMLSIYTFYVGATTSGNDAELLGRAVAYLAAGMGIYAFMSKSE